MFADDLRSTSDTPTTAGVGEAEPGVYRLGSLVQLATGDPTDPDAVVMILDAATVILTSASLSASVGDAEWSWLVADLEAVFHGGDEPWTILAVPGIGDHGVAVRPVDVARFRHQLHDLLPRSTVVHCRPPSDGGSLLGKPASEALAPPAKEEVAPRFVEVVPPAPGRSETTLRIAVVEERRAEETRPRPPLLPADASSGALAGLTARAISAWFGTHLVLDRVSLEMAAGHVTALIGPSGCGKSTFLRILNRMHELIPSAAMAGEVLLDGEDIYAPSRKVTDARRQIGMVFQKPNPFPAMSIYDNVLASFQLTGTKVGVQEKDQVVEACLSKAGLWNEVRDRLRQPGGSLSGGQQQRLCIARALAIRPRVLLMDEPCSALDPTSTRRIEQTIAELKSEVTIVIVTHNMQQASRVSDSCAFFLAEQNTPGLIVEHGPTEAMFHSPQDQRTSDYVNGRFG